MDYTEQLIWSCYGIMELDSREHDRHRPHVSAKPEDNFVIGISGCTSAGKTTLALLLDVVLREAVCRMVSNNREHNPVLPPHTAIIHQDAYFFKDKIERGPMVPVQPLWPEDKLVASMTGPNDPPILVEDRDRVGSCDIELLAKHVDEPEERTRANVPNPRFLANLQKRAQRDDELERDDISPAAAAAADELSPETLDAAVEAMRDAFRRHLTNPSPSLTPTPDIERIRIDDDDDDDPSVPIVVPYRFTVAEGFTLFARDPDHDPIGRVSASSDAEAVALRSLRRAQDRFDVPLFLPVDRDEARARRFKRERYMDAPEGARRPGELWKSGGYFEQVAWPHYERYHQHILPHLAAAYSSDEALRQREHGRPWCATNAWERDPLVNGVHVRPAAVRSLDDTLLWAASVVGAALAARQLQDRDPGS